MKKHALRKDSPKGMPFHDGVSEPEEGVDSSSDADPVAFFLRQHIRMAKIDRQYNKHDLVGDPCSYNKSQMVTENIPWSVSIFISP